MYTLLFYFKFAFLEFPCCIILGQFLDYQPVVAGKTTKTGGHMSHIKLFRRISYEMKRKLFLTIISMILLSAPALAEPVAEDKNVIIVTNAQDKDVMNIKPLVADFDIIASFSTNPPTINFIDKSAGSPTSWFWDFGDNSISTAQNPIHEYIVPTKYDVTLTVNNSIYSDTVKKVIIFSGYEKYN
jgi:hypothetical protein